MTSVLKFTDWPRNLLFPLCITQNEYTAYVLMMNDLCNDHLTTYFYTVQDLSTFVSTNWSTLRGTGISIGCQYFV